MTRIALEKKNPLRVIFDIRDGIPKVAIDREDCFNKLWQCPIILPMPKNQEQCDFINEKMIWLKTKEGYKISNTIDFDKFITEYPKKKQSKRQ